MCYNKTRNTKYGGDEIATFGRKNIYTLEPEIKRANIVGVIRASEAIFNENSAEISYLWDYYRGKQPILQRVKKIRPEINNVVVENHALEIADFYSGYFLGESCSYVRRGNDNEASKKIDALNEMMFSEDKASYDKELATWLYVCGIGFRMCLPDNGTRGDDEAPFELDTCDPINTFVVKSSSFGKKVMLGAQKITKPDKTVIFCGYTDKYYFELNGDTVDKWEPHNLGCVPIFEYEANSARMGAFEPIISLLDAINKVASNRIDGVEQFIQSIMVLYNADIEDESAKNIGQFGLVKLKSVGDTKADLKLLNEQLNQSETQTLVAHMVNTAKEIVGMPNNSSGLGGGASGNVGSVLAWQGWDLCEPRVKETEQLFKRTEKQFLRYVLKLLKDTRDITLRLGDIDVKFSRRNIENLLVKAQSLQTLLSSGIAPEVAIATVGLWNDPMNIASQSAEFLKKWATTVPPPTELIEQEGGGEVA